ncbi:alpha/beta fold hydrolase [Burkholderia gladioli]
MHIVKKLLIASLAMASSAAAFAAEPAASDTPSGVKNIVLVHDAFTDGSGWRTVHDILYHHGYHVRVVQQPLTSLSGDVAAVRDAVVAMSGPVVLVGHGYGGSVITEAGARGKVAALVYVAAFQPDVGESVVQLIGSMPQPSDSFHRSLNGNWFIDPAHFGADYAGDIVANRTDFMAISQMPGTDAAFSSAPFSVAWHDKPSYAIVAARDRVISPELQRWMARRAGSKLTEVNASHAVEISQPEAVARVIEEAASSVH